MAKHAASDSDDGAATSPKRPRINGTGPSSQTLPASTPPPLPKTRTQTQAGSDDDDDEEDDMDVEEDEEEQARQTQQVKAMRNKTKATGQVAQAGIIEQVHLENFMSHKLTTVNFGPQINFLVGMNGSGKSAILTGITMALGGNAKLTNRASKSSGFVREGCNLAKASVKLRNRGSDAYHHSIYGDSITIERTLRVNGGGAYKMMSAEGVTIDTKKHTLDLILDHFNIQVDNPMTVLSQDQSRQFLASASAKDKYQFFLRGTQLQQLTEEYELIRSNTEAMEEALERKKEVLPELKDAYRRARERAKDAEAAVGQQEKVDKMKEELAWSYVDDVEDSVRRGQGLVEKEEKFVPKIEQELAKFEANQAAAEEEIGQCEEAAAEAQAKIEELTPEAEQLSEVVKKEKAKAAAWRDHERKTNASLSRMRIEIEGFEQQLADEQKKLARNIKAEQQPILDQIARLNDEVSKIGSNQMKANHDLEDLNTKNVETVDRLHAVRDKIGGAEQAAATIREQIATLNRAKGNSLFAYGQKMPEFLRAIEQERSWREKPIGPAGSYIKLKQPRYAAVLEAFFAHGLNSFIVTNEQDRALLSRIHRRVGLNHDVPIILARRDDSFFQDVVNGEPHSEILTMRRALAFDNPLVEQAMIVSRAIERCALVPLRPDGDDLLRTNPNNVLEAYSADSFKLGFFNGKSTTNVISAWRGAQRFNPDVTGQIRNLQEQHGAVEQDLANFHEEKREIDAQLAAIHNQRAAIERNLRQGAQRIQALNRQLEHENGRLREDEPTNIAGIEAARKETQAERESMLRQYEAGVEERDREKVNLEPTVIRKGEVEKELRDNQRLANQLSTLLEGAVAKRVNAQSSIDQYNKKLVAHKAKIAEMQRQVDDLTPELNLRTEQASTICARPEVEKKRSTAKLTQEIQNMEKALKDREKRQGATTEQIMSELAVRRRTVQEATTATNDLAKLVRALDAAYQSRIMRWADFRDQIAARAKLQFLYHLSNRGFTGKLSFDHEKNALHIRVQTEDAGTGKKKKTQLKDSKALSGGEKSFSTICLLLTMWEAVGCPLRCLDEFDVFMDAVNRRISMKMMVDTAKAANGVQFILITPQDMGSATYGPEVRISKLQDPDRNQGVLATGR